MSQIVESAVFWISFISSLAGLVVGWIQSVRMRELRKRTNHDLWLSLRMTRAQLKRLEESQATPTDPLLASAHGSSKELFCHLLKQAINEEKRFTEETIQKWRAAGKLDTDWQVSQARQFLQSEDIK